MSKSQKILKNIIIITNTINAVLFMFGLVEINHLTIAGILFQITALFILEG